jgi:uncharacterized protein DUF2786
MGKNNRSRRAAKQRRRAKEQARTRTDAYRSPDDSELEPDQRVESLLRIAATVPFDDEDLAAEALAALLTVDPALVGREAERHTLRLVRTAWVNGWQPVELVRQAKRHANASVARLAVAAIATEHGSTAAAALDPRWSLQLDSLGVPRAAPATGWVDAWAAAESTSWAGALGAVVALLSCLSSLGRVATLIPPPGGRAPSDPIDLTARANDPMLDRVRALLAQAKSTPFEAEAEAFTVKAQELMTRHAIDAAMLAKTADRSDPPITIRIPIDDPYVDAKSLLLQCVAEHSRCRAVFHEHYAMSSIVGFADDVAATELLFTSLLVQAHAAMAASAATAPAGARSRSRSFRAAFLVAYANRIAQRLAEINAGVVSTAEAETGTSIVPVLAARSDAVDAAVTNQFGDLDVSPVRGGYDAAGFVSGELAADRARLSYADLTAGHVADEVVGPR